jgi:hypothetical protein
MSDLAKAYKSGVPADIREVAKEVLIGRDRLDAIRAAINAAKKLNKPTYDAMKAEGREYGERILDCELRLKAILTLYRKQPREAGVISIRRKVEKVAPVQLSPNRQNRKPRRTWALINTKRIAYRN